MKPVYAHAFAEAWLRDWNGRHLGTILEHYAEGVVFRSPRIAHYTEGKTDTLTGRAAIRPYFARGLANRPGLKFELVSVHADGAGLAIVYRGEDDTTAVETMSVDADGKVIEVRVFYDHPIA